MILRGGRVAIDAATTEPMDVGIEGARLRVPARDCAPPTVDCRGMLILPGLINAHDHLEFNLFPRLGSGPYPNASAWARDIHHPNTDPIRRHLAVPKRERLLWGGLKNLLSGVTTVMHHNPYDPVFDAGFPVRVVRRYGWAHSPVFDPNFAAAFRATPAGQPFILHAAEGVDPCSAGEIPMLEAAGALASNTVVVHGVGLDRAGVELMLRRRASLVWCPTSNLFMLGETLERERLEAGIPVALGTDSALTAAGDMLDEVAAAASMVGWSKVYRMVTSEAAAILRLREGEGEIREGGVADLLVLRDSGRTPADSLANLTPEMVLIGGQVRLLAPDMAARSADAGQRELKRLRLDGRGEWLVRCPVPDPAADLRLAGRRVA